MKTINYKERIKLSLEAIIGITEGGMKEEKALGVIGRMCKAQLVNLEHLENKDTGQELV